MAKLVFLKRTQKEIEIFGGDVYFDIDGKNAGKLSLTNQIVEIPAGEHTVKMYKSHTFDTFKGFAESVINVIDDEQLMVKYSAPMMINQPGNMVISEYTETKEQEVIREREYSIHRDFIATETQKKQAEENYKNGVMTVVWVAVGIAVVLGIFYGILFSSF
ncbi:MAG: hypothetical protein Q4B85_13390 [Lachnospiraceae bacterium]|nr:hypothetical protein [Lachnospiraceae bacterium]